MKEELCMTSQSIYRNTESKDILLDFYDGIIGNWTFPNETADIPTRFGDTHTITAGRREKPALLLLHGSASNILGWGAAIPAYMSDFYVVAPDIPGEAGRSGPVRPSWDSDEYVLWLDDLLDGLGIRRAALLGISLGGWIAAKYAAQRPERVNRLVLLAPGGISPARTSSILKTILYSMQKEKGAEKMKHLVFGKGEILPEVSRFFDLLQEHYIPRYGSPKLLTDMELRGITCHVLMSAGSEDAFFNSGRSARRLKALIPGAEICVAPAGSHGIIEYGGRIAGFLATESQ
jgi:pimeloyl-ACP methyl ester carboxylesterase